MTIDEMVEFMRNQGCENTCVYYTEYDRIYENLECNDWTADGGPYECVSGVESHMSGARGYWTLSSSGSTGAWNAYYNGGYVSDYHVSESYGVRPVINLSI